jgi:hypothetical protein
LSAVPGRAHQGGHRKRRRRNGRGIPLGNPDHPREAFGIAQERQGVQPKIRRAAAFVRRRDGGGTESLASKVGIALRFYFSFVAGSAATDLGLAFRILVVSTRDSVPGRKPSDARKAGVGHRMWFPWFIRRQRCYMLTRPTNRE